MIWTRVVMAAIGVLVVSACTVFAHAQAAPTEQQRRDCERNGGYWSSASSMCRIGA